MADRPVRLGDVIDDYCPRCRLLLNHDVASLVSAEVAKVTWPTRPELIKATRMIVVLSMVLGVAIGLLDWVLQKILVDGIAALAR